MERRRGCGGGGDDLGCRLKVGVLIWWLLMVVCGG